MAVLALAFISFALTIWWTHSGMDLCTMGEPAALKMSVVLTLIPYLVALALLRRARMQTMVMICSLPVVLLLTCQAAWGVRLFIVTNVEGVTSCRMISSDYYGPAWGGWFEQAIGPYYIVMSLASLLLIALSYLRHRTSRAGEEGAVSI